MRLTALLTTLAYLSFTLCPPPLLAALPINHGGHFSGLRVPTPAAQRNVPVHFIYDGDGGRVKQITASGTTTYLGELVENDASGKTTNYIFAGSQRIASTNSTGAIRFYHTDHLGSSNVITDSTGTVIDHTEYTPYGSVAFAMNPEPRHHKLSKLFYAGHEVISAMREKTPL